MATGITPKKDAEIAIRRLASNVSYQADLDDKAGIVEGAEHLREAAAYLEAAAVLVSELPDSLEDQSA